MTGYGKPKINLYSCRYNKQTIPVLYPYARLPRNSLSANSFARPRYARKPIRLFQLCLLFSATFSYYFLFKNALMNNLMLSIILTNPTIIRIIANQISGEATAINIPP